jgi:glycosyltransferase involved in cell wall biosynthesis
MAKVVTVYAPSTRELKPVEMGIIRWLRISEAIAARGHQVDLAVGRVPWRSRRVAPGTSLVRMVPLMGLRWGRYDAVKTLFHRGYETLCRYGGGDHPWVIAKLGSVVAPEDRPGIYFYGRQREQLFRTQERIAVSARHVTVLTDAAGTLFRKAHGRGEDLLLVPGAAETHIPPVGPDPYPNDDSPRVVFLGSFYSEGPHSQPEAHRTLTKKLNRLGRALAQRGVAFYVVGPGQASSLDADVVRHIGPVPYGTSWDYMHHADVGVVVTHGDFMHNNESTKIYYYLRTGLPVVSELGFPNDHVLAESGLGRGVPPGEIDSMAERVMDAIDAPGDRECAIDYILNNHTWDQRAATYDAVLRRDFG